MELILISHKIEGSGHVGVQTSSYLVSQGKVKSFLQGIKLYQVLLTVDLSSLLIASLLTK